MKIAVLGLWHLGMVTAACLAAEGHDVVALDDKAIVDEILAGRLPIEEPGLTDLVAADRSDGRLTFAADPQAAAGSELIWVCYDTPVDANDVADPNFVLQRTAAFLRTFAGPAVVAISSQLPVGSVAALEQLFPGGGFQFAAIPENLRLGSAIAYFRAPDRFIAGVRTAETRATIDAAIGGFAKTIVWMNVESAEMTKHALNAFLATSVVFANELAAVCERVGADARDVEQGLKSDVRIGPKAYLRAGEAFSGGTLARDLAYLGELGNRHDLALAQTRATVVSNTEHRAWAYERVMAALPKHGGRVGILGLVYKPGTNTLRGSESVVLARRLREANVNVRAFDPAIAVEDERMAGIAQLVSTAQEAIAGADVVVVATAWPEFRTIPAAAWAGPGAPVVIDIMRFLEPQLGAVPGMRYVAFGKGVMAGSAT